MYGRLKVILSKFNGSLKFTLRKFYDSLKVTPRKLLYLLKVTLRRFLLSSDEILNHCRGLMKHHDVNISILSDDILEHIIIFIETVQ